MSAYHQQPDYSQPRRHQVTESPQVTYVESRSSEQQHANRPMHPPQHDHPVPNQHQPLQQQHSQPRYNAKYEKYTKSPRHHNGGSGSGAMGVLRAVNSHNAQNGSLKANHQSQRQPPNTLHISFNNPAPLRQVHTSPGCTTGPMDYTNLQLPGNNVGIANHPISVHFDPKLRPPHQQLTSTTSPSRISKPCPPLNPGTLPPGWESGFDHVIGRSFYVDHNTQRTTWEHPLAKRMPRLAAAPTTEKPPGGQPSAGVVARTVVPTVRPSPVRAGPVAAPVQPPPVVASSTATFYPSHHSTMSLPTPSSTSSSSTSDIVKAEILQIRQRVEILERERMLERELLNTKNELERVTEAMVKMNKQTGPKSSFFPPKTSAHPSAFHKNYPGLPSSHITIGLNNHHTPTKSPARPEPPSAVQQPTQKLPLSLSVARRSSPGSSTKSQATSCSRSREVKSQERSDSQRQSKTPTRSSSPPSEADSERSGTLGRKYSKTKKHKTKKMVVKTKTTKILGFFPLTSKREEETENKYPSTSSSSNGIDGSLGNLSASQKTHVTVNLNQAISATATVQHTQHPQANPAPAQPEPAKANVAERRIYLRNDQITGIQNISQTSSSHAESNSTSSSHTVKITPERSLASPNPRAAQATQLSMIRQKSAPSGFQNGAPMGYQEAVAKSHAVGNALAVHKSAPGFTEINDQVGMELTQQKMALERRISMLEQAVDNSTNSLIQSRACPNRYAPNAPNVPLYFSMGNFTQADSNTNLVTRSQTFTFQSAGAQGNGQPPIQQAYSYSTVHHTDWPHVSSQQVQSNENVAHENHTGPMKPPATGTPIYPREAYMQHAVPPSAQPKSLSIDSLYHHPLGIPGQGPPPNASIQQAKSSSQIHTVSGHHALTLGGGGQPVRQQVHYDNGQQHLGQAGPTAQQQASLAMQQGAVQAQNMGVFQQAVMHPQQQAYRTHCRPLTPPPVNIHYIHKTAAPVSPNQTNPTHGHPSQPPPQHYSHHYPPPSQLNQYSNCSSRSIYYANTNNNSNNNNNSSTNNPRIKLTSQAKESADIIPQMAQAQASPQNSTSSRGSSGKEAPGVPRGGRGDMGLPTGPPPSYHDVSGPRAHGSTRYVRKYQQFQKSRYSFMQNSL